MKPVVSATRKSPGKRTPCSASSRINAIRKHPPAFTISVPYGNPGAKTVARPNLHRVARPGADRARQANPQEALHTARA